MDHKEIAALDQLFPASTEDRRSLADIILSTINQPQSDTRPAATAIDASDPASGLDPRIVETFTQCVTLRSTTLLFP